MNVREVHAFREVLSQKAVGVLVRAALPWASWITEVNLDAGVQTEALMIRHLFAMIPGQ